MSYYDTLSEESLNNYVNELLETIEGAEGSEEDYTLEAASEAKGELEEIRKSYINRRKSVITDENDNCIDCSHMEDFFCIMTGRKYPKCKEECPF